MKDLSVEAVQETSGLEPSVCTLENSGEGAGDKNKFATIDRTPQMATIKAPTSFPSKSEMASPCQDFWKQQCF